MRNMKIKNLALIIALTMSLSLAACSGGNNNTSSGGASTPSVTPTPTPTAEPSPVAAETVLVSTFESALALAESRGHMKGQYSERAWDDLIESEYLTAEEKAAFLRHAIDEQREENRQTLPDEIFEQMEVILAKYESIYDSLTGRTEHTDSPSPSPVVSTPTPQPDTQTASAGNTAPAQTTTSTSTTQQTTSTPATQTAKYTEADLQKAIENVKKAEANRKSIWDAAGSHNTIKEAPKTMRGANLVDWSVPVKANKYNGYFVFGNMSNGVPNGDCYLLGIGQPYYDGGERIIGNFTNGKQEGLGWVQTRPVAGVNEFNYYFGNFKNGSFNGLGRFDDNKGNSWVGEWVNGEFTGYGWYFRAPTNSLGTDYVNYFGYFEKGVLQGAGMMWNHTVEAYAIFKDFEPVELLTLRDISAERNADFRSTAEVMKRASEIFASYDNNAKSVWSDTQSNIDSYKSKLAASQPPAKFHYVPSLGTDAFGFGGTHVYGN